jgi:hypothetical protein
VPTTRACECGATDLSAILRHLAQNVPSACSLFSADPEALAQLAQFEQGFVRLQHRSPHFTHSFIGDVTSQDMSKLPRAPRVTHVTGGGRQDRCRSSHPAECCAASGLRTTRADWRPISDVTSPPFRVGAARAFVKLAALREDPVATQRCAAARSTKGVRGHADVYFSVRKSASEYGLSSETCGRCGRLND